MCPFFRRQVHSRRTKRATAGAARAVQRAWERLAHALAQARQLAAAVHAAQQQRAARGEHQAVHLHGPFPPEVSDSQIGLAGAHCCACGHTRGISRPAPLL